MGPSLTPILVSLQHDSQPGIAYHAMNPPPLLRPNTGAKSIAVQAGSVTVLLIASSQVVEIKPG